MHKPREQSVSGVNWATPTAEGGQPLYDVLSDYPLPVSWNSSRLEDLAIKVQDGTHFSPKSETGPFRYLTSKNIRFGYLDIEDCGWISQEEHREIFRRCDVAKGDVLLTKDGANTGNAALNSLDEPFSLLSSVAMIRCNPARLHEGYLLQYLLSPAMQKRLKDAMSGNAISRIILEKIKTLRVIGPQDTNEQRRIAAALDAVDEAIRKTNSLIMKLDQVRVGLLHDLLTRGLDENGNLRSPITHPEQFKDSPLGRIPREWAVSTVGQLELRIIDGDRGSHYPNESHLLEQGFCVFLNNKNIVDGSIDFSAAQFISEERDSLLGKGKLNLGDIVITTRGTVGNIALFSNLHPYPQVRINSGMIILRSYENVFISQFFVALWKVLFPSEYRRLSSGSAQPQFPIRDIQKFRLVVPNRGEQERIVSVSSGVESALAQERRILDKLKRVKIGLMADLLTGRVRVPEESTVAP